MSAPLVFPYLPRPGGAGLPNLFPLLPARLSRDGVDLDVVGLVDTGAAVSVLPYDIGLRFGIPWQSLTQSLSIGGLGTGIPAKFLAVELTVGSLSPVAQLFAWANSNNPPVIFGQTNFFMVFDVCFFRSRDIFQIQPSTP